MIPLICDTKNSQNQDKKWNVFFRVQNGGWAVGSVLSWGLSVLQDEKCSRDG